MINTLLALAVIGLLVLLFHEAKKYGRGNLVRGLKRYVDLNYETPEDETARINQALADLYVHLSRKYGPGWRLTMLQQEGADNQIVVEKLYKKESLPSCFGLDETVWNSFGNEPEDRGAEIEAFLLETILEPRQLED